MVMRTAVVASFVYIHYRHVGTYNRAEPRDLSPDQVPPSIARRESPRPLLATGCSVGASTAAVVVVGAAIRVGVVVANTSLSAYA